MGKIKAIRCATCGQTFSGAYRAWAHRCPATARRKPPGAPDPRTSISHKEILQRSGRA